MEFPSPTPKQARILWLSLTALAVGVLLALVGLLLWGFGWLLQRLSAVLLPLAIAGIFACLLDPIVDFFVGRKIPRARAILLVFFIGVMAVVIALGTVVPRLIVETQALVRQVPHHLRALRPKLDEFMKKPPFGLKLIENWQLWKKAPTPVTPTPGTNTGTTLQTPVLRTGETNQVALEGAGSPGPAIWNTELTEKLVAWITAALPEVGKWMLDQLSKVASWAGLLVGLALVPVYMFYFLLEKRGISRRWTDYLPIHESRSKEELIFILTSVNDYLILFFRGQILVALCDGALLTIGFLAIGLNYALLLGLVAGLLSIVPFLGVVISLIPALILAVIQFGDWLHPLLVLGVFALVQLAEGLFISPKIMGDRVGLHPLTIIIAVMVGTTLMGGILGGILAIPLTAALRVLMFRYVWKARGNPTAPSN
jgi:predicted PurR-regulated permease PerM